VRLLQAGEVLSGAIAVAVPLEATVAVAAPGALTGEAMQEAAVSLEIPKAAGALEALAEEAMEEVTGELKNRLERRTYAVLLFYPIPAEILSFTQLSSR
jgi:hypothetical protein